MPLRPLGPRVATMVSRHEFVLGPWEIHTRPERVEINRRPVVRGLNLLG
jgi:hypothetical protein